MKFIFKHEDLQMFVSNQEKGSNFYTVQVEKNWIL